MDATNFSYIFPIFVRLKQLWSETSPSSLWVNMEVAIVVDN